MSKLEKTQGNGALAPTDERKALRDKGQEQRGVSERLGRPDDGSSNHPETKRTGYKSGSNAGEDLTSGDG